MHIRPARCDRVFDVKPGKGGKRRPSWLARLLWALAPILWK
ncbi:hypothetical protein ACFOHT_24750 [Massilia oculi]|nr:hypothetical protein [Massilia oculi]